MPDSVMTPLELSDVSIYFNPVEIKVTPDNEDYLTALMNGVSSYVEVKCNIKVGKESPAGLLNCIADMILYHVNARPQLQELRSEDMGLVFNTKYPSSITSTLSAYRRLTW